MNYELVLKMDWDGEKYVRILQIVDIVDRLHVKAYNFVG